MTQKCAIKNCNVEKIVHVLRFYTFPARLRKNTTSRTQNSKNRTCENRATRSCHLPCISVRVTSLAEHVLWLCPEESVSWVIFLMVNAGCFGRGRSTISLLIIEITVDMEGLSFALSCVQRSPTFMHLRSSASKCVTGTFGSTNAITLSSFHNFHACKLINAMHYWSSSF